MIPRELYESTLRRHLAPLVPLLDDESVSEILVNNPREVFVERGGQLARVDVRFSSSERLLSALRVIAQYAGRAFDEQHPVLEARLPDGSRVEALHPPISPEGPSLAIRRFSKKRLTLGRLIELGALTEDAAELLRVLVECKQNLVVAGGTGSGKTSMLNALSALVPEQERVIVIEDARELQLQRDHVLQLETRPPDARGRGGVTVRDLFKASLRMRPDRIVLGEIRGGEALDLVQAMTSGHGGSLTTVHATYPIDAMNRLETMALMGGVEIPLSALRAQLASAVDIVVQTARLRCGRRVVTHIAEVAGADAREGYRLTHLFEGHSRAKSRGTPAVFALSPTGALPECRALVESHGMQLPATMHAAARRSPERGRSS